MAYFRGALHSEGNLAIPSLDRFLSLKGEALNLNFSVRDREMGSWGVWEIGSWGNRRN
ncbi:MAG: hypothetical protein QNJ74_27975 [Trichodesmium sp. MO_231.B1]|nr:hypothetical protein [Trichodesmium sp. MO_231.B1]